MSARIIVVAAVAAVVVFLKAGSAAAQWEVDATVSNASIAGLGGGLMYSCASDAPSRGAIMAVFSDTSARGRRTGYIEVDSDRLTTSWECATIQGNAMCAVTTPAHVPRIRDMLIRGSAAMAVLGTRSNPAGAVIVSLEGSSRAIARIRRQCR